MDQVRGNAAKKKFSHDFMGAVGTVEGGDGALVMVQMVSASSSAAIDYSAQFGCPPGELAILALAVPAGELRAIEALDPADIVIFPKTFDGLPVYYMRGEAIRPQKS